MTIEAGINLFSIHQEQSKDYFGALERVAAAGYTNLELNGINMSSYTRYIDEIPADTLKEKLKQLGLTAVSAHEMCRPDMNIDAHDWESVWSYYDRLKCYSIVLPSVWITGREDTLRTAEQLNLVGTQMRNHGFTFYLHNHAHEFKKIGEHTLFDLLIENTDPACVRFELDLIWVLRAGLDPVDILKKLGDRCDIVHQKDISKTTAYPVNLFEAIKQDSVEELDDYRIYQKYTVPEDHADLGAGAFDFSGIYKQIHEMDFVRYAIVENEGGTPNKMESIANDLKFLKNYL
jgi:sugar phosphate isomerase/epimerase